jgi:hypothetical protein
VILELVDYPGIDFVAILSSNPFAQLFFHTDKYFHCLFFTQLCGSMFLKTCDCVNAGYEIHTSLQLVANLVITESNLEALIFGNLVCFM